MKSDCFEWSRGGVAQGVKGRECHTDYMHDCKHYKPLEKRLLRFSSAPESLV
jgi:hypothetical protein